MANDPNKDIKIRAEAEQYNFRPIKKINMNEEDNNELDMEILDENNISAKKTITQIANIIGSFSPSNPGEEKERKILSEFKSIQSLNDMQNSCTEMLEIKLILNDHKTLNIQDIPIQSKEFQFLYKHMGSLEVNDNNILIFNEKTHNTNIDKICVPSQKLAELLPTIHKLRFHLGPIALNRFINRYIFSLNSKLLVQRTIETCNECTLTKNKKPYLFTNQQTLNYYAPNECWNIDLLFLQKTKSCSGIFLTIIDEFSNYSEIHELTDKRATTAATALLKTIRILGIPESIKLDFGTEYLNKLIFYVADKIGINLRFIKPTRKNSLTSEILHKQIQNLLRRTIANKDPESYHTYIKDIIFALNHSVTKQGYTPYEIFFGRLETKLEPKQNNFTPKTLEEKSIANRILNGIEILKQIRKEKIEPKRKISHIKAKQNKIHIGSKIIIPIFRKNITDIHSLNQKLKTKHEIMTIIDKSGNYLQLTDEKGNIKYRHIQDIFLLPKTQRAKTDEILTKLEIEDEYKPITNNQ